MNILKNKRVRGIGFSLATAFVMVGCVRTPKASVELSTTVGRDIALVRVTHLDLAKTLFGRMKNDVNHFVDQVYAPYQIQFVLSKQKELQASGNPKNLFSMTEKAVAHPTNSEAQKEVLLVMQAIVEMVHEDVEEFRQARLAPILKQEREMLDAIETSYDQIQRGNATVTAHLASIVQVHEAQDEIFQKVGLKDLREKVSLKLSSTSSKLAEFVSKAKPIDDRLDDATTKVKDLTKKLDELVKGD